MCGLIFGQGIKEDVGDIAIKHFEKTNSYTGQMESESEEKTINFLKQTMGDDEEEETAGDIFFRAS